MLLWIKLNRNNVEIIDGWQSIFIIKKRKEIINAQIEIMYTNRRLCTHARYFTYEYLRDKFHSDFAKNLICINYWYFLSVKILPLKNLYIFNTYVLGVYSNILYYT